VFIFIYVTYSVTFIASDDDDDYDDDDDDVTRSDTAFFRSNGGT